MADANLQRTRRIRTLIFDVVCNPTEVYTARSTTTVSLFLYGANKELLGVVSKSNPASCGGAIVGRFDMPTDDGVAQIRLSLEQIEKSHPNLTYAIFTITQRRPAKMLGEVVEQGRVTLFTSLQVEVLPDILQEKSSGASTIEVTLGSFDPDMAQMYEEFKGSCEIVAAVVNTRNFPDLNTPDGVGLWSLIPIRSSGPLLPIRRLKEAIEMILPRLLSIEQPYGPPLNVEDILSDILSLQAQEDFSVEQTVEEPVKAQRTDISPGPSRPHSVTSHESSPVKSKSPMSPQYDSGDERDTIPITNVRDERRVLDDMQSAMRILKEDSLELKDMAKRIYATDWKKSPSSSTTDQKTPRSDESTLVRIDVLEKFRRDLREEFLDVLQNYTLKTDVFTAFDLAKSAVSGISRICRDIELVKLRQQEVSQHDILYISFLRLQVDAAVQALSMTVSNTASRQSQTLRGDRSDSEAEYQDDNRFSKSASSDPLVKSFVDFMRSLETSTQLTGTSFRQLQTVLHYPEAFKDIATGATYPCSRKLLQFVSSKKAAGLIEDMETLAGVWRAAGTNIPADRYGIGQPDIRDFKRKPWWPLRPFNS